MFLLVCVILSRGRRGLCLGVSLRQTPWERGFPGQRPPHMVKSGQYGSYWNAFFLSESDQIQHQKQTNQRVYSYAFVALETSLQMGSENEKFNPNPKSKIREF